MVVAPLFFGNLRLPFVRGYVSALPNQMGTAQLGLSPSEHVTSSSVLWGARRFEPEDEGIGARSVVTQQPMRQKVAGPCASAPHSWFAVSSRGTQQTRPTGSMISTRCIQRLLPSTQHSGKSDGMGFVSDSACHKHRRKKLRYAIQTRCQTAARMVCTGQHTVRHLAIKLSRASLRAENQRRQCQEEPSR